MAMPTRTPPSDPLGVGRYAWCQIRERFRELVERERPALRHLLLRERALMHRLAGGERITLTIHFEDAGEGWIMATVPEVPGAISQGRTRAEARENVIDALQTILTPDSALAGRRSPGMDDEPLTLTVS